MNEMDVESKFSTRRGDGQKCPIVVDVVSGEAKLRSASFYAYNKQNYANKVKLAMKHPISNAIFEFMVSEMDNTNAICISMATMEKLFNLKRNALTRHIKHLVENKFITIFKVGNMNAYAVNAYLVWTQGDANLYKAKFAATMYLNYDEQTPEVKREFSKKISAKK